MSINFVTTHEDVIMKPQERRTIKIHPLEIKPEFIYIFQGIDNDMLYPTFQVETGFWTYGYVNDQEIIIENRTIQDLPIEKGTILAEIFMFKREN